MSGRTWAGRRVAAAGVVALAAGVLAATPALAAPAPAEGGDQLLKRAQLACDRIPNLLTRSENLADRLAAGPTTRGSLAWLEAQADRAADAGREDLATALENRLAVREDLAALLPGRIEALEAARDGVCADLPEQG